MPIYEYRCEKCGQVNEFILMGKEEQLQCKRCGSGQLTKLLSAHNVSATSSRKLPEPSSAGVAGPQTPAETRGLLFRVSGVLPQVRGFINDTHLMTRPILSGAGGSSPLSFCVAYPFGLSRAITSCPTIISMRGTDGNSISAKWKYFHPKWCLRDVSSTIFMP